MLMQPLKLLCSLVPRLSNLLTLATVLICMYTNHVHAVLLASVSIEEQLHSAATDDQNFKDGNTCYRFTADDIHEGLRESRRRPTHTRVEFTSRLTLSCLTLTVRLSFLYKTSPSPSSPVPPPLPPILHPPPPFPPPSPPVSPPSCHSSVVNRAMGYGSVILHHSRSNLPRRMPR